jgi:hypothetical protein
MLYPHFRGTVTIKSKRKALLGVAASSAYFPTD